MYGYIEIFMYIYIHLSIYLSIYIYIIRGLEALGLRPPPMVGSPLWTRIIEKTNGKSMFLISDNSTLRENQ